MKFNQWSNFLFSFSIIMMPIICFGMKNNLDALSQSLRKHFRKMKHNEEWSPVDDFRNYPNKSLVSTPPLGASHVRVVSAYSPPSVTYIEDGCTSKACFKGIFANVFHALAEQMNFTFSIRRTYMWGSVTNGTWNGMVGMLKDKLADIVAADLTITNERSTVVDFLPALMEITEELYMQNPGDSFSTVSYIGAFTKMSWIAIALWTILMPIALSSILKFGEKRKGERFGLWNCYLFIAASLVNITYNFKSSKTTNRVAILSVFTGGILIFFHWEAELTSHLAFKKIDFPFNNLLELSQNSDFKFIVGKGTIHLDYFKNSDDPVRRKIWHEKLEPHFDQLPLVQEIEDRILNDPYTAVYSESIIKMTQAYLSCKIVDIKPPIRKTHLAFATQKNSPLYPALKHHINHLKEFGLVQKYIKSHRMEAQVCKDYSGEPVTIKQCYSAFKILSVGMLISFCCWIFELFVKPKWIKTVVLGGKQKTKDNLYRKQKTTTKWSSRKQYQTSMTMLHLRKTRRRKKCNYY